MKIPLASLFVNFILIFALSNTRLREGFKCVLSLNFFKACSLVTIIWLISCAGIYLFCPRFFDHVEATISNVALAFNRGHEIYTSLDSPFRYSVLYGPISFLVNAWAQTILIWSSFNVIWISKFVGIINLALTLVSVLWLLHSLSVRSLVFNLIFFGAVCSGFLNFDMHSYWNRPDSFLIMFVALGLLMSLQLRKAIEKNIKLVLFFSFIFGSLLGLAGGSKAHAILYFFPLFVFAFEVENFRISKNRLSILFFSLAAVGVSALLFTIAPFLIRGVSFEHFLVWLSNASKHGISFYKFFENLTFFAALVIPMYIFRFTKAHRLTFLALVTCGAIMSVLASKPGAGTHHFIPFIIPIFFWSYMLYLKDPFRNNRAAAALLIALYFGAFESQRSVLRFFKTIPEQRLEQSELTSLAAKYKNLEMGYNDVDFYDQSFYESEFIQNGGPLLFDGGAIMDMTAASQVIPQATYDILNTCKINFILPHSGIPWGLKVFFTGQDVFDSKWKDLFHSRYQVSESGTHYDVYTCKEQK
jgi:hypothetical protein